MADDKAYLCTVPGCNYKGRTEGYLKLHVESKHGNKGFKSGSKKNTQKNEKDEPKSGVCPECGAEMRLLNRNVASEGRAFALGFKKVCTNLVCKELG